MPDISWDGTAAGRVELERTVRSAEALVTRCKTRFLAATRPASEAQVSAAMQAGGILAERIGQYITEWSILKLQGEAAPTATQRAATDRAVLNELRAQQGLRRLRAAQYRAQNLIPQSLPALPPEPAPQPPAPAPNIFGPRSQVIPPAVPELPELPQAVPPAVTQRPEDLPPPFGTRGIV